MSDSSSDQDQDQDQDRDPIERLADSFITRFRAGERPSIDDYAARYPELADEIHALLPALVMMEQDLSIAGVQTGTGSTGRSAAAGGTPPRQLGDFTILREVGRGGMGVVYEAVQQSLGRHVALKVLGPYGPGNGTHRERFRLEARAAARLHHANIVPIYGVGEHDGTLYYAMQFIPGHGLDVIFEELRKLRGAAPSSAAPAVPEPAAVDAPALAQAYTMAYALASGAIRRGAETEIDGTQAGGAAVKVDDAAPGADPRDASATIGEGHSELTSLTEERYYREIARVGIGVAEALAYAHGQGVLHRDIKPSNLLMDAAGTVWVTDFGLAKQEGSDGPTQTGDVLGTLRYMAPERFDGWSDPRSDVYALGATLYELLTLQPLFADANRARLIDRVLHDEPAPLRKIDARVPRDLETIVLKALAKEPAARYASAAELAADLRRFVENRPIAARRVSAAERAWRWCRRNPAVAGLAAALLLLLVTTTIGSMTAALYYDRLAQQATRVAEGERNARLATQQAQAEAEAQRQRADASYAQALAAVDDYHTKITESRLLKVPGLQPLRTDLLQSALAFYQEFLRKRGADPTVRARLAGTHLRVGRILQETGRRDEAKRALAEARRLYEDLTRQNPGDREAQNGLAESLYRAEAYPEAIAVWERLLRIDPENAGYQRSLALAYNDEAIHLGRGKPALDRHRQALALREALVRRAGTDAQAHHDVGETLTNLGTLLWGLGQTREALDLYERAAEHSRLAYEQSPQVAEYGWGLVIELARMGVCLRQLGKQEAALERHRETIDILDRLAGENPSLPWLQSALFGFARSVSYRLQKMGRGEEAARLARRGRAALERLPQRTAGELFNLARAHALCAAPSSAPVPAPAPALGEEAGLGDDPEARRREADRAVVALGRAVDAGFHDPVALQSNPDFQVLRDRDDFRRLLARVEAAARKAAAEQPAAPAPAQAATASDLRRQRLDHAAGQYALGLAHLRQGLYDEARTALEQASAVRAQLVAADPTDIRLGADLAATRLAQGRLEWQAGRVADGRRYWQAGLELLDTLDARRSGGEAAARTLAAAHFDVAQLYSRDSLWAEAAHHLGRSLALDPTDRERAAALLPLLLLAGDVEAYRHHRTALLARIRPTDPTELALGMALRGLLLPASGPELAQLDALADRALGDPRFAGSTGPLAKGLAAYRKGRFADAESYLAQSAGRPPYTWEVGIPLARVVVALVRQEQGKVEEARAILAEAEDRIEAIGRSEAGLPEEVVEGSAMATWLNSQLLGREAHARIQGRPLPEHPVERLHRGAAYLRLGSHAEAEAELRAAVDLRPADPAIWLARSRLFTDFGEPARAAADLERAEALAAAARSADPMPWIVHGHWLAARGELTRAEGAFDRAARLTAGELNRFLEVPWWVAGPFPEEIATSCPPEHDPDPARPVATNAATLAWRPVAPTNSGPATFGRLNLAKLVHGDHISAYALTYVSSPDERTATLLVGGSGRVRVWVNGALVHETKEAIEDIWGLDRVPIVLRAGRNTLLAKVSHTTGDHYLSLRLDDNPLDRAGQHVNLGLWKEASNLFQIAFDRYGPECAPDLWNRWLILLGATGRVDEYRRLCASPYAYQQTRVLAPGGTGTADPATLLPPAGKDAAPDAANPDPLPRPYPIIALYRAGRYEETLRTFKTTYSMCRPIVAMAHHRLGHAAEARSWLARCDRAIEEDFRRGLEGKPPGHWDYLVRFLVLYREAKALIEGTPPAVDALLAALRSPSAAAVLGPGRDRATEAYDRLVAATPDDPRAWLARARRLADLERWEPAGADITRALALKPGDPELLRTRDRILTRRARSD